MTGKAQIKNIEKYNVLVNMNSIQFYYFSDEKGEEFIRKELINRFGITYMRDYFRKTEVITEDINDFRLFDNIIFLTSTKLKEKIIEKKNDNCIRIYESPVIEYDPSNIREDGVFIEGRLAYFGGNEFPEFKKEVQSLFRKLKKHCWKDKQWKCWVFETIGDEATVFIPNRDVHLKKN